jgi:hypothetical protein
MSNWPSDDWTYATPYALRGKNLVLITREEFYNLPEYSASNPTGVYYGKMWRRHNGIYDLEFRARGGNPKWMICQYLPHPTNHKLCITKMFYPFFVRRLKMPTHYGGKLILTAGSRLGASKKERAEKVMRLYNDPTVRNAVGM